MKIADVTYTGKKTYARYRGPSGERYVFASGTPTGTATVTVESYVDAKKFESCGGYEVNWSKFGQTVNSAGGSVGSVSQTLSEMVYQQKQTLAASLGMSGKGSEEDLDERLRPAIEELQEEMEGGPNP